MHSSYTTRIARLPRSPNARRWLATSLPSGPSQKNTNNLILLGVGAAASVGAYYYLRKTPPEDLSGRAKIEGETMVQKARESLEAGKARSEIARKEALQKYEHAKKAGQAHVEQTLRDAQSQAKELSSDAQARYDSYKDSASDTLSRTRSSMDKVYDDTKAAADRKLGDTRSEIGKRTEQVKRGWFSWLGWGKSEAQKGKDHLEDAKRTAAGGAANTAKDAGQRAEKHT